MREKADTDLGWFKVSNDLAQALARANITANEYAVCGWVMCRTYGVRKRVDDAFVARKFTPFSRYQIAKDTGRDLSGIIRSVDALLSADRGILRTNERGEIGFNTRLGTWASGLIRGRDWEMGAGSNSGQASTVDGRPPLTGVHHDSGRASTKVVDGRPPSLVRAREEKRVESNPLPPTGGSVSFGAVWKLYPKKIGFGAAFKVWRKLNPSIETAAKILAAIKAQAETDAWKREGGRWVPELKKWLREHRWNDEALVGAAAKDPGVLCKACGTKAPMLGAKICLDCSWCLECDRAGRPCEKDPKDLVRGEHGKMICRECSAKRR